MAEEHSDISASSPPPAAGRVLLVEDNQINLEIAIQVLEEAGLTVVPAECAQSAVSLAAAQEFDFVLMDLQLPDFDGWEATRRIREQEAGGRRTPVVALTGSLHDGDIERCIEAGMDGYEEKPLTAESLERLLTRWTLVRADAGAQACGSLSPERLAQLFRDSAARLIAELRQARDSGDVLAVQRVAHTLKSICARVPAAGLGLACGNLETLARGSASEDYLQPAINAVLAAHAALDPTLRDAAGTPAEPREARRASVRGPLVLVVDDEENERFLVRRTLETAGYRVEECESGSAAVELCERLHPDAILLDGLMPGMDGVATCRALRGQQTLASLPILMFSGLADPAWQASALAAGANCCVEKSVGINELRRNLLAQLAGCGVFPVDLPGN